MSDVNLDLTGNETAEELEAMLERLGDVEISDVPPVPAAPVTTTATAPAVATTTVEQTKTGDTVVPPTPGEKTVEQAAAPATTTVEVEDKPQGILGKDGKHVIPYAVLEAARAESRRIAESNQQTASELEQTKRQLQMLTQQINQAGLTPVKLPENTQITPEQLTKLQNDFPEMAGVITTMVQKIDYLQQSLPQQPAVESTSDPVTDAIKATPDLDNWKSADPDRFILAVHIDDTLKSDPTWKDKPLTERFSEVVRRTKAAYGENVDDSQSQSATTAQTAQTPAVQLTTEQLQKIADDKLAAAKATTAVPASPSDIGSTTTHQPTLLEQAINADNQQLQAMFAGMSEAQIDALLDQTL